MMPITARSKAPEAGSAGTLPLLTQTEMLSDLAILKANPILLDAFLPAELRHASNTKTSSELNVNLEDYSPNLATKEESVALSYAFSAQAKEVLEMKAKSSGGSGMGGRGRGAEDVQGRLEAIGREAEGLNRRLEAALQGQ